MHCIALARQPPLPPQPRDLAGVQHRFVCACTLQSISFKTEINLGAKLYSHHMDVRRVFSLASNSGVFIFSMLAQRASWVYGLVGLSKLCPQKSTQRASNQIEPSSWWPLSVCVNRAIYQLAEQTGIDVCERRRNLGALRLGWSWTFNFRNWWVSKRDSTNVGKMVSKSV